MQTEEKYVLLRVAYPGSRVLVLGQGCLTGNFKKLENQFERRYERLADGREQHVYLLPDYDLTYEVEEVVGGKRIRWYCATLEGDNTIHRITQYGAKVYARRAMSLRNVVREYPPMPDLAAVHDEEEGD